MRKHYLKNYVLLFAMLLVSGFAFAQTGSISGTVLDTKRETLPGVTVSVDGTTLGTATDVNGAFKINGVTAGAHTLTVKYIGYVTMQKAVTVASGQNAVVEIQMSAQTQSLNEVVVIGYGTATRKDVTGSVATVSSKDFQKGSVTTPEQLIAGKVAGVAITSNGGQPGVGSQIRIRGGASLNATNDPLIIVDGVSLSNNGISGSPNPLSLINPNDIETFTVLKDASATAIYGSRASNGVILITTKKGQSGAPKINFSSNVSAAKVVKTIDVFSASEYRDYVTANGTAAQVAKLGDASTDWQKQIYQTAIATDNNLSVSGTYKNLPYRVSVGYLNQDGILKTDNLERTSGSINLNPKFFDNHLKVNFNVKGAISKSRFANQGAIGAAVSMNPTYPIMSGNDAFGGYYEVTSNGKLEALAPRNPVALLNQKFDNSTVKRSIGNAQFDYSFHFLPELHANLNLGYDYSSGEGTIVVPDYAAQSFERFKDGNNVLHSGINNQYSQKQQNRLGEFYLSYNKDVKSIESRFDVVAGYAYQIFRNEDAPNGSQSYGFPDQTSDGSTVVTRLYPDNVFQNVLISYYGRLNYTYKGRYILTGTLRTDGSSRFKPENRWSVFPSAALAWNVKEESFIKDADVVSSLKFRGGYGVTGQQEGINLYDYRSFYNLSTNTAQYQMGDMYYNMYRPGGYYDNRKWESTATTNIAIDYGFLNERLTGTIEFYYKKTKDLLSLVNQPAGTNFANQIVANIGNMENKGIEFSVNAIPVKTKDLTWNVSANVTYNTNKITNLTIAPDPNFQGNRTNNISGGTGNTILINSTGYRRGSFYVYEQVYDAQGKPLDNVFVDRNGDGTINEKDLYRYKGIDPKAFFGFSTSVSYKNWSAGTVLRGSLGNYVYNNVFSSTGTRQNIFNPIGYLNNGSTNVLETGFSGSGNNYFLSDYYVQNASFLRMDNVNLGYNFGKLFKSRGNLRVSANVQNVFTITKYKGLDPEVSSGVDNNFYPRPRTFVLGLNLDL
ncbi:TonB-dependent receptor [Mucilaginibacter gynuensis]|uniref:TonB-dependent receptor n=1 Tax=Mucilaginibacter gynuensis TaxID=1302236 RepID=A0ABP8GI19_9SPHI